MGIIKAGTIDGSTKELMPGYPMASRDGSGSWSLEYRYHVNPASALGQAAAHGASPPAPEVSESEFSGLRCASAVIMPGSNAGMRVLKETYVSPQGSGASFESDVTRSTQVAAIERPIEEHPSLNAAQIKGFIAAGRDTFIARTLIYRRKDASAAFTWSEANVVSAVGSRNAPTDLSSPTLNAWLKIERNVTEGVDLTEIEEAWQYDENLWDTTIFS